jgi:antitoxin PrlF
MQAVKGNVVEAVAKVTAKGQTTIPKEVREALEIAPGDLIVWEVVPDRRAVVRRVQPWDLEYLRAVEGTLSEWLSPADEEAYRDL